MICWVQMDHLLHKVLFFFPPWKFPAKPPERTKLCVVPMTPKSVQDDVPKVTTCFQEGMYYANPVKLMGTERTVELSAELCQQRCQVVPDCALVGRFWKILFGLLSSPKIWKMDPIWWAYFLQLGDFLCLVYFHPPKNLEEINGWSPQFAEDVGTFFVSFWVGRRKNDRENSPRKLRCSFHLLAGSLAFFEQRKWRMRLVMTLLGVFLGVFWRDGIFFFGFWRGDRIGSCLFWVFFFAKMRAVMSIAGEYFTSYCITRIIERL